MQDEQVTRALNSRFAIIQVMGPHADECVEAILRRKVKRPHNARLAGAEVRAAAVRATDVIQRQGGDSRGAARGEAGELPQRGEAKKSSTARCQAGARGERGVAETSGGVRKNMRRALSSHRAGPRSWRIKGLKREVLEEETSESENKGEPISSDRLPGEGGTITAVHTCEGMKNEGSQKDCYLATEVVHSSGAGDP